MAVQQFKKKKKKDSHTNNELLSPSNKPNQQNSLFGSFTNTIVILAPNEWIFKSIQKAIREAVSDLQGRTRF